MFAVLRHLESSSLWLHGFIYFLCFGFAIISFFLSGTRLPEEEQWLKELWGKVVRVWGRENMNTSRD